MIRLRDTLVSRRETFRHRPPSYIGGVIRRSVGCVFSFSGFNLLGTRKKDPRSMFERRQRSPEYAIKRAHAGWRVRSNAHALSENKLRCATPLRGLFSNTEQQLRNNVKSRNERKELDSARQRSSRAKREKRDCARWHFPRVKRPQHS